jgi:hypothetical protein
MYDICITKIGVVPMTRRSDILKILSSQPSSEPCSTISRITVYPYRNRYRAALKLALTRGLSLTAAPIWLPMSYH